VEDIKKIDPKSVSDIFQIAPIALDTYDDIFSDFDPSPFDHRVISEDFLSELRRRYNLTPKDNFVVPLFFVLQEARSFLNAIVWAK
jgi:hypothetical protein